MLLCQLMAQSMNIYLFTDYFKSATLLSVVSLASFIPMLIMAPIARILSEKFGKKESYENIFLEAQTSLLGKVILLISLPGFFDSSLEMLARIRCVPKRFR